ncbi:MAG: ACT domain-containing protein [Microthrixaceae bacterium]|nr:ACT domain-containing protein [Microthrixaceae bacterium]
MALFVVRVWLPDRPGALGAVASRIGAVHADVVGIDILERGAGRAVDELTIDIADARHVDLLVQEIAQVDGVDVEHVRPARSSFSDRAGESLELAASIMEAASTKAALDVLVVGVRDLFDADWAAVIDPSAGRSVAVAGGAEMPSAEWLSAFIIGTGVGEGAYAAVDELARTSLPDHGAELVVSRQHLPLREGERRIMATLARITDRRREAAADVS